ncbi:MAG: DUF134 domain-containing protein [Candidatus Freyarchaeota archaeon]|nr:DUF134 domain-containing protein [Candidatus Freyrarchaeum guaymaensis]
MAALWGPGGRRRRCRGRPLAPRDIEVEPHVTRFVPVFSGFRPPPLPPVTLYHDELEALRLVDQLGLTQEEAGDRMGVSRGTIWRLLQSGRKKVIQALVEGREIMISPRKF